MMHIGKVILGFILLYASLMSFVSSPGGVSILFSGIILVIAIILLYYGITLSSEESMFGKQFSGSQRQPPYDPNAQYNIQNRLYWLEMRLKGLEEHMQRMDQYLADRSKEKPREPIGAPGLAPEQSEVSDAASLHEPLLEPPIPDESFPEMIESEGPIPQTPVPEAPLEHPSQQPPSQAPTTYSDPRFEPMGDVARTQQAQVKKPDMSTLEMELGEKWFQRIGLIVLSMAFIFLMAIVMPRLTEEQVVGLTFACAGGLALLGEYLYSKKDMKLYAKGLEAGAFAIAYIGVWGGGFYLDIPNFPWAVTLGAIVGLNSAASLRYRSSLLSIETGMLYLAWIFGLRSFDVISALAYAATLSFGVVAILGLLRFKEHRHSAILLVFAFNIAAHMSYNILGVYGPYSLIAVLFATGVIVSLLRLKRVITTQSDIWTLAWFMGIVISYSVIYVYANDMGDFAILAVLTAVTAAFVYPEIISEDQRFTIPFLMLIGIMTFAFPFLMQQGIPALLMYPTLLMIFTWRRPVKELTWLINVVYIHLIAYLAVVSSDNLSLQLSAVWVLFFFTILLHIFMKERAEYIVGTRSSTLRSFETFLTEWHVPLLILALTYFTIIKYPYGWAFIPYGGALILAILFNLRSSTEDIFYRMTWVIVIVGTTMVLSTLLTRLIDDFTWRGEVLLAIYNIALLVAMGFWATLHKVINQFKDSFSGTTYYVSLPIMAILIGLFAQQPHSSGLFIILPLVVLLFAFYLDDAITFNLAYIAFGAQCVVALSIFLGDVSTSLLLFPAIIVILMAIGFALEVFKKREILARLSQLTSSIVLFFAIPGVFGTQVETTVLWTILGVVNVGWGLSKKYATLRYNGILLFFAVIGKVFLYDISGLAIEVRILGLIIVAVCLLVISYGYAQYRKKQVIREAEVKSPL